MSKKKQPKINEAHFERKSQQSTRIRKGNLLESF